MTRLIGEFLSALVNAEDGDAIVYVDDAYYGISIGLAKEEEALGSGAAPTIVGLAVAGATSAFEALLQGPVRAVAPGIPGAIDDFSRLIRQPLGPSRGAVPSTGPSIIGPVAGGAVVLVTALQLAQIAGTVGAINAVVDLSGAIGQGLSKRKKTHCRECIERALLSQDRPRKRMEVRILRRV